MPVSPLQMGRCSCFSQGPAGVSGEPRSALRCHVSHPAAEIMEAESKSANTTKLSVHWVLPGEFFSYLFLKLSGITEVGFFGEGMTEVCFTVTNPHGQN